MLTCFHDGVLPVLASLDPALVNRIDSTGRLVEGTDVDFDLMLIAAEKARPANRTEASPPKRGNLSSILKLLGSPVCIGKKRRTSHLATIGAVTEPAFVGLVPHSVADCTAQAASFS